MPDATLQTIGRILENKGPVLYRAELKNGKVVLAHLSKALTESGATFVPEQRVVVEMTPYDFDQARILRVADE